MHNLLLVLVAVFGLTAASAFADKPKWAGEGGKPSSHEIEEHKDDMRNKNNAKKHKKGKDDGDWGWGGDDDKDKDKDKDKHKGKDKDKDDWEKDRKQLEENVRANNRGMIGSKPLN